ncbi:hypothetical protein ACO0RG_004161 [Hanseniaspora osmophila]
MTNAEKSRPRILMLHGHAQSDKIFSSKTGALRKGLTKQLGYDLYYPCAPTEIQLADFREEGETAESLEMYNSTAGTNIYTWFHKDPVTEENTIPEETIGYLRQYVIENGPFEGIIGFSQGAAFAGYLASNFNELLHLQNEPDSVQCDIKWFMNYSGFRVLTEKYQARSYNLNPNGISIPSLHVIGELDSVVEETRVMSLYEACDFEKRTLLKHPGGHFIPNNKVYVSKVCGWLNNVAGKDENSQKTTEDTPTSSPSTEDGKLPVLDDDLLDIIGKMGKI